MTTNSTKQLESSERRFRQLTDTVPAVIWETRPDGYCTYLNQQWYDLTGQTPAQAEGFGWLDATHPDDKAESERLFLEANQARTSFNVVYRLRHKNGSYRWAIDKGSPRFGADSTYQGMIGTVVDIHDQKMAEAALQTSETKLRSLIESAPVLIGLLVGRDLVIDLPNQTFIDIVGKGPDIVGKTLREVMPELVTENQPFLQILDDVYTTGRPFQSFDSPVDIMRQGILTRSYYNITYSPLYNEAGEIYAILDVAVDVTGQILAQQQVVESERRFQNLIQQANVGIVVLIGEEMRVEIVNDAYAQLIDRSREDLLGKPLFSIVPETESPFRPILDGVRTTGEPFYLNETPYFVWVNGVKKEGFVNVTYQPYREHNGVITGVVALCQDVTEQVLARQKTEQTQADLLEINQRLSLALDAGNLGSFVLERETGLMRCTPQCRANHGQQPDTMPSTYSGLIEMIVPDDRAGVEQAMTYAFDTQTSYQVEYRNFWPDGSLHWIRASGQPVYSPDGQSTRMVGITQNITAQRMARKELERLVAERTQQLQESVNDLQRSNNNLQQFAYVASHDLQEPLRKIQSFGDMLRNQYKVELGESGNDYLGRMQASASRMSVLIKDLLTYSRISTQQDSNATVSLTSVINTVLADLDLAIQETGAVIGVDSLPTLQGDKSQLGQLFQNLLNNALKFRKPGQSPRISITAHTVVAINLPVLVKPSRAAASYHCIAVSDNGIGFDEQYVDRIFQVFQRLHGKSQFAGTGIGLAICEKVAANHGGAITASSQPGQGATFSVYLPS